VHDSLDGRWWAVGDVDEIGAVAERMGGVPRGHVRVGEFSSGTGRERYVASVRRALELIAAGDVFQVNLAHRLSAEFGGRPRELAARMVESARPWFGAWIEWWEGRALRNAVLSLSPELFLDVDGADRRVVTRPIKGTRPAGGDARELLNSEKECAELTMIVDLMRNDLGRVCDFGSVRVERAREIEAHAGVIHGVATVSGRLRARVGLADLLRATFPPGSVTGAPKVRAMQIIDELEPVRRGPYCGSVGFVSDCGRACWSVAIRTATLTCESGSDANSARGTLDYSVGAGIVADSDPEAEWEETLSKARMLDALGADGAAP
jgi:para-aminobenzoate synthetase component 1